MEDQLRLFLLLGGTVFIIAVLAHGIWKIRKNSKPAAKERLEPRQWQDADDNDDDSEPQEGFDELGIGAVRVVGQPEDGKRASSNAYNDDEPLIEHDVLDADHHTKAKQSESSSVYKETLTGESREDAVGEGQKDKPSNRPQKAPQPAEPKLYGSVVTNPKPHMKGQSRSTETLSGSSSNESEFPEPPGFLLREGADEEVSVPSQGLTSAERCNRNAESDNVSDNADSELHHLQGNTTSSGEYADTQSEKPREEQPRAAQKFYIDPTVEEELVDTVPPARNEREVADFSLDAPEESYKSRDAQEENEQPKRFARSKRSKTTIRRREEPNFGDDQMRIDFDSSEGNISDYEQDSFTSNGTESTATESSASQGKSSSVDPEVLVLNVRTPEGEPISGAALLPMLLTLGFKFGDQDIFHRHVNSNGKGPVLFSLANMFKPGVFDIDNLETFETQGVSLFMILPIEGDPHQVFNMMHNAARKLADEFGAQVLDGRRSVLTKQGLQQYVEKIREFERKRMISRN